MWILLFVIPVVVYFALVRYMSIDEYEDIMLREITDSEREQMRYYGFDPNNAEHVKAFRWSGQGE